MEHFTILLDGSQQHLWSFREHYTPSLALFLVTNYTALVLGARPYKAHIGNVVETMADTFMKSKGIETANTWFKGARTRPTLEMLWETMVSEPPL
jgi:hypothetical protein